MAVVGAVAISPSGEYFAYSSPDGTLKLWDTPTGTLKQEYTPSSHLSATCTCLAWRPTRQTQDTPKRKKKKRKSEVIDAAVESLDLIAMGTSSGTVLIYSLIKGDLHTQLVGEHTDTVNGVAWQHNSDILYSCSSDRHIVQWSVAEGSVKHKWKADRGSVNSVCMCSTGQHLLSAGRTIKLWDLQKFEVLKTFTGHATEIFRLLSVSFQHCGPDEDEVSLDSSYCLSAAVNDRLINAWQLNVSSKQKNAVASFALPDEAVYIDVRQPTHRDQPFIMVAITKSGALLIFEHVLNGQCKAPLKPKVHLQVASDVGKGDTPRPIPVLGASICDGAESQVLLAHGNFIRPVFERHPYKSLESPVCLVRKDTSRTALHAERSVSKVQTPDVSKDLTVLTPGHMAPSKPTQSPDSKATKKRRKSDSGEMPMASRLNAMSLSRPTETRELPRADTLATLLSQGLQSRDKKILNNVLQHTNETIIRNTVRRLPVPLVVPLVHELAKRMHGHAQSGHTLVKWVKTVLTIHTSYLTTLPELVDTLGTLYQMMDSRVTLFSRLSKLQGKLDLMLSHVSAQTEDKEELTALQPAMLVYQDESSDEDIAMEAAVNEQSESEDDWEKMEDEGEDEDEDSKERDSDSSGSDEANGDALSLDSD